MFSLFPALIVKRRFANQSALNL